MTGTLLTLSLMTASLVQAEEVVPSEEQTKLMRGTAEVRDGIRAVRGETDATGHDPITYDNIPFDDGTFSLSWKVDVEQHVVFVFDGKANGKATHAMKVFVNGAPGGSERDDVLTLVSYDGSTKQKKKAIMAKHKHHADAGQWHKTIVTFENNQATLVLDNKTFTATSGRFCEPLEKCGVIHMTGMLQTKNLKILKAE